MNLTTFEPLQNNNDTTDNNDMVNYQENPDFENSIEQENQTTVIDGNSVEGEDDNIRDDSVTANFRYKVHQSN